MHELPNELLCRELERLRQLNESLSRDVKGLRERLRNAVNALRKVYEYGSCHGWPPFEDTDDVMNTARDAETLALAVLRMEEEAGGDDQSS